jgi:hypothetical protein
VGVARGAIATITMSLSYLWVGFFYHWQQCEWRRGHFPPFLMVVVISGHLATTNNNSCRVIVIGGHGIILPVFISFLVIEEEGGCQHTIDMFYFVVFSCSLRIGMTTTIQQKKRKKRRGVGRWEEFRAPPPSLAHLEFA